MTHTVLVAGTASHVGKSTVAAGLCRLLADRGVDVAPFKAQNMSNNARAVPRPGADGPAYGEIGVSQYVQARAARRPPSTDHNPVLLKPRGGGESQLVIHGEAVGHFAAGDYFDDHWERARSAAVASFERLAAANEVVVAEGAGSIAEINLHDRDLANVETARFSAAQILLVVDIERGGAFAALVGTLELLPDDLRERVVGALVTKFRGDASILEPGIDAFEARTGVPVLGVLPYDDPGLPEEDSVSLPAADERAVWRDATGSDATGSDATGDGSTGGDPTGRGADGAEDAAARVTIAVPRFPRVSNATDVEPLAAAPGVAVEWLPLDGSLADADAVVLPGTKNAVDDLLAAREAGFDETLRAFDGPVVGLCGGYQLLGQRLRNVSAESPTATGTVEGFGLLPVETEFTPGKTVAAVERDLRGVGPLSGASGTVRGYEIHAGDSRLLADVERPFPDDGAARGRVVGTYLHGLFENRVAREAFLDAAFAHAGRARPAATDTADSPYDRAAALLAEHAALESILPELETAASD